MYTWIEFHSNIKVKTGSKDNKIKWLVQSENNKPQNKYNEVN